MKYHRIVRIIISIVLIFLLVFQDYCSRNFFISGKNNFYQYRDLNKKIIDVAGVVTSIPVSFYSDTCFYCLFEKVSFQDKQTQNNHANIQFLKKSANKLCIKYPKYKILPGDRYNFTLKIKILNTFNNNPYTTNFYFTVKKYTKINNSIYTSWYFFDRIRSFIYEKIKSVLQPTSNIGFVSSLSVGIRQDIQQSDWNLLKKTGTNHLFAIAGLHLGIVFYFAYKFFRLIINFVPYFLLRFTAQKISWFFSIIFTYLYSILTGLSIPTKRALIMFVIAIFFAIFQRNIALLDSFIIALIMVLFFDKMAIYSDSLYLSFGTTLIIIYSMAGSFYKKNKLYKLLKLQKSIAIGIMPITIYFFHLVPFVSTIANLITIPIIGFLVLPLCIIADIFSFISFQIARFCWILADKILFYVKYFLLFLISIKSIQIQIYFIKFYKIIISMLGVFLFLLPHSIPIRWFGLIWIMPIFIKDYENNLNSDFVTKIFDVGDCLSILIKTKYHSILYDTGYAYASMNYAEKTIVPFFEENNMNDIDALIISVPDINHMGGLNAIVENLYIENVYTTATKIFELYDSKKVAEKVIHKCYAGYSFSFDEVNFFFISPDKNQYNAHDLLIGNNACALKVNYKKMNILIASDIDKLMQAKLANEKCIDLKADFLIAPNHGRKDSIDENFLRCVNPKNVVFSEKINNKYHWPLEKVLEIYSKYGILVRNTAREGTITIDYNNFNNLTD